jgi:hypothetical protein
VHWVILVPGVILTEVGQHRYVAVFRDTQPGAMLSALKVSAAKDLLMGLGESINLALVSIRAIGMGPYHVWLRRPPVWSAGWS